MAALAEYNGGGYVKPKEIVVADFLDLWIEEYVKINLRHKIRTLFLCALLFYTKTNGIFHVIFHLEMPFKMAYDLSNETRKEHKK